MIIESIKLSNFRNYENGEINFSEGVNILYGENAQGKTNLLEAAYISGTTKSHKGSKDREIILFGKEEAHIQTNVKKKDAVFRIDLHLKKSRSKGIAINQIPIKKAYDLFGILNIIFFSPEDLNIIKNGPSERRRFMDAEICQLDKIYLSELMKYNKALAQRNQLLKDIREKPKLKSTLGVWNETLSTYGKQVISRRRKFIKELNEIIGEIHSDLSGGKEKLVMDYEADVSENDFETQLILSEERDLHQCMTNRGPHRDDVIFKINDIDVRHFGSQGQQRTAALSLKLAEIELVKRQIHEAPVLLLDDVLSELDHNRQNYLLRRIGSIQTVITCTGLDEFVKNNVQIDRLFEIKNGRITQEN
jgi:DNA replication and repair protein RecF